MSWTGPLFGASAALAVGAAVAAVLLHRTRDAVVALALCFLGAAGACLALGSGFVFILAAIVLVIPVPAALLAAVLVSPPAARDDRGGARNPVAALVAVSLLVAIGLIVSRRWPPGGGTLQTSAEWLGFRALTDHSLTLVLGGAVLSMAALAAVALLRPRGPGR